MNQQGRGQEYNDGARDWVQRDSWKDEPYHNRDRRARGGVTNFIQKGEVLRKILDAQSREGLGDWILEVKRRSRGSMGAFFPVHIMTSLNRMTKLPPGKTKETAELTVGSAGDAMSERAACSRRQRHKTQHSHEHARVQTLTRSNHPAGSAQAVLPTQGALLTEQNKSSAQGEIALFLGGQLLILASQGPDTTAQCACHRHHRARGRCAPPQRYGWAGDVR